MARREDREAFVTLATNDTYALGCLVLGSSLRRVGTTRKLAVMVTSGVSQSLRDQLSRVFDLVNDVDLLDSRDPTNLQLLGRPDLNVTFTKFHCWRLTMYDKAVFLDADTLVLQNVDELFNREELSAAPDAGWPDCFNSGVFVFKPSEETYNAILQYALDQGSFDGGDQGLLNMYFRDWATKDISRHLPFIYNVVSQAFYSYLPAFKQFKDEVKIVHFIGATKPWHQPFNTSTGEVTALQGSGHNQQFLQTWWTIFMTDVQPFLDPSLMSMLTTTSGGLIGELAVLRISKGSEPGPELSSQERKLNWEKGQVDYLGADSFDNIKKKLDASLTGPPEPQKPTTSPFSRPMSSDTTAAESSPEKPVSTSPQPSSSTSIDPEASVIALKPSLAVIPVSETITPSQTSSTSETPKPTTPSEVVETTKEQTETAPVVATPPKESRALKVGPPTASKVAPATTPNMVPGIAPKPTSPTSAAGPAPAVAPKVAPQSPAGPAPAVAPKVYPKSPAGPAPAVAPKVSPTSPAGPAPKVAPKVAPTIEPKVAPKPAPAVAPKTAPSVASKFGPAVGAKPTSPTGPSTTTPKVGLATAPKVGLATAPKIGQGAVPKVGPGTFPKPTSPTSPTSPASKLPSATSPGAGSKEPAASKPAPVKKVFNPFAAKFGK